MMFVCLWFSGVAMMFGRGVGGLVGNAPRLNPVYVTVTSLLCAAASCALVPFCATFSSISACTACIGFMLGE